jgi:glycosyltransferase involved in cell wall biosynthesis
MKNKVLLISPYSNKKVGGINTWTKSILDYNEKHNLTDLIFLNTSTSYRPNLVRSTSQRLVSGIFESLMVLVLIVVRIIKYNPRTIHYTSSGSYALIKDLVAIYIAKLFGIRFIIHWRFGRIPELHKIKNLECKIFRIVSKSANLSIVLDQESFTCLNNSGINNVVKIPNPISENLQTKALSIDFENKPMKIGTFVFVGQIIPDKGIYELVNAGMKIKELRQLILIGPINDNIKEDLLSIASARNNNDWLVLKGVLSKEEILEYLYSANALCLPSYTEGFPNVVLEAMAVGCPVIATKVGAIEEMLTSKDFGNAGICIEPKSINQLTHSIEYIIANPEKCKMFGKNGNQRVISKYFPDKVFSQYRSIW